MKKIHYLALAAALAASSGCGNGEQTAAGRNWWVDHDRRGDEGTGGARQPVASAAQPCTGRQPRDRRQP
jgi:hypothetical protein